MALDAAHLLVAVHAARAFLRARHHALAVQNGRAWLGLAALACPHRSREQGGDVRPHAIGAEAVVPGPHGLPRAELLG